MLSDKETTALSKFLSLVLRHKPQTINLTLDDNGWTSTEELLEKMNNTGKTIDIDKLKYIVDTNAKKRFAFNNDFSSIRASQGHSVSVELGYTPQEPPSILYHGTAEKNIASILSSGLVKGNRHHVHLSSNTNTAITVGSRHGKPVLLEVAAGQMHYDGHHLYVSGNGVWLTEHVPSQYLKFLNNIK